MEKVIEVMRKHGLTIIFVEILFGVQLDPLTYAKA
jgi:hypothetical protein